MVGREAGKRCVVADVVDETYVLVSGPGIKRRRCNIGHLEPLDQKLKIRKGASDKTVEQAFASVKEEKPKAKPEEKPPEKQEKKQKAKPEAEPEKKPKEKAKPEKKPKEKAKSPKKAEKPPKEGESAEKPEAEG